jgi:hypothetical protein
MHVFCSVMKWLLTVISKCVKELRPNNWSKVILYKRHYKAASPFLSMQPACTTRSGRLHTII